MRKFETYKCEKCGNIVEITNVGGGKLSCCGQEMKCITENLTPVLLMKAFAGESMARNKYEYFAKEAFKEGYKDIANHFNRAADNEKMHAKLELKAFNMINSGKEFENTSGNLQIAIDGENYEHQTMYPDFAQIAKEEGYKKVATLLNGIQKIEITHEEMYKDLKERLDNNKEFEEEEEIEWICEVCGHIHKGKKALKVCPVCDHPRTYQLRNLSKK